MKTKVYILRKDLPGVHKSARAIKEERSKLQELQRDTTRWFTQEEFNRLKELNQKMFSDKS